MNFFLPNYIGNLITDLLSVKWEFKIGALIAIHV